MYYTLLYYKIVAIKKPERETELHTEVCKALGLKGRILISDYGINGNIGGTRESIELYQHYMDQHRLFHTIDWKRHTSDVLPFPKLRVRYRDEIITTEAKDKIDWNRRGKHVDRDTFHQWLVNGEEMVIIDMRNDYEWAIGRFKDSIKPPVAYFRELKDSMNFYDQFKGKKIVMYCTGGIRCEPASALFAAYGFDPEYVYQLEGGIVKYAEKYGNDGFFEGKCFTFDDRMVFTVNTGSSAVVVGECALCGVSCDTYRNCAYRECNLLYIGCDDCVSRLDHTCCTECQSVVRTDRTMRRPFHHVQDD